METTAEREQRIERLEADRRRRREAQTVWPTPDDVGTGVVPIEIAPGRGDLNYSSGAVPTFPTSLGLIQKNVSFARLFQSQPWVAAAVMRMLTWAVRVPLKAYRSTGSDSADREHLLPGGHPVADMIANPWPGGSQSQLVMNLLGPVLVHGNSVTEFDDGDALSFTPKDWRFTMPIMPWRDSLVGFKFDYDSPVFGHEVSADKVLHIAWWSPTGPIGTSPLMQLGVTLVIEDAAQRYQRSLFVSGGRPPSVLTTSDAFLGMERAERQVIMQQLRSDLTEIYGGPENMSKPALLPPGLDWKAAGQSAVEAALIDQRKITREEIAAVYLIPPPLMGILDKACLPATALVSTTRGPVVADQVKPGDQVFALVDGRLKATRVSWSRQTGVEPLVTIRTGNRTLRCTRNHPLLVAHRYPGDRAKRKPRYAHEWIPAGQVKRGDLIVTATCLPDYGVRSCSTRENVTEGFAEFCGLLLGDGNVKYDKDDRPSGIGIARAPDARYMDHYRRVMREEFRRLHPGGTGGRELRQRRPITVSEQERQTRFSSRLAAEEMVELGLAGTAHTKRVPEWVGALAPDLRAAFLRGYADADGAVDKRGHLTFHSANETLLRQVRELCIGLGVPVCNVRMSESWVRLPNGQRIFSVMWQFKAADPEANASVIGSHDPVDLARMRAGRPWRTKRYRYRDGAGLTPPQLEGCGHARVLAVEKSDLSVPVYDIEVPEGHNFVVDGVVAHNTYANIQSQREMTYTDCLGPPLVLVEQCLNAQIIRDLLQIDDVFVEFDFGAVLRGSRLDEIAAVRDAIGSALMSPNEGRGVLQLARVRNPAMDEFYLPFNNLQPVGAPPVPQPAPPPFAPPGVVPAPSTARRLLVRSRDRDYEREIPTFVPTGER
jgi:hypothetical protein